MIYPSSVVNKIPTIFFAIVPIVFTVKVSAVLPCTSRFNFSDLDGDNGFILNGIDGNDQAGFSVSSAGDVNGDGIDDIIVGANRADPNSNTGAGEAYVVFGRNTTWDAMVNLTSLNGTNGFTLNGIDGVDQAGFSVSSAGDVNGDGIDDIIVGALQADPNGQGNAGEAYVVFGRNTTWDAMVNLTSLNGTNGFTLNGIDGVDLAGRSVSSAGDVNGDGIDDIIVGAPQADPNGQGNAGEAYVVFGRNTTWDAMVNLTSLNGTNGFTLNGIDGNDRAGRSVSSAGDVNGDGIDDIIVGANLADPTDNADAGEAYVVFGKSTTWDAMVNLTSLNGTNGFTLNGIDGVDRAGRSVSSAGDVNGDGIDDIIVGAPQADPNGRGDAGEAYVVFGRNTTWDAMVNLTSLNGTNGFTLNGIDGFDFAGTSVSSAGDVNGDGIDDIIVGALQADPNSNTGAGEAYVVFGKSTTWDAMVNLTSLDGTNGFTLNGIDGVDLAGRSVSSAGDVNGDGIDDVIIGARLGDPNGRGDAGEVYVVFGFVPLCTPTPSSMPSNMPSTSVSPSLAPSWTPSLAPSATPSSAPSATPSLAPSLSPSLAPSATPSLAPSLSPSLAPSATPSSAPSATPSLAPSLSPSLAPSATPSLAPSVTPSFTPSLSPSSAPSGTLSSTPSVSAPPSSMTPSMTVPTPVPPTPSPYCAAGANTIRCSHPSMRLIHHKAIFGSACHEFCVTHPRFWAIFGYRCGPC